MAVSRLYLELVRALDARRRALGLSMARLDDKAGGQDGYWGKATHPEAPAGRQSTWDTLQLYADAMFPGGVRVLILPAAKPKRRPANQNEPEQLSLDLSTAGQHCTLDLWRQKRRPPRGYRVRPRRRAAAA